MANDAEEWRSALGLEGRYEVSNLGRARSIFVGRNGRGGDVRKSFSDTRGYLILVARVDNRAKTFSMHRLVAHAFLGPCPAGMEVNHKNGVKGDCRATNLEYVTASQNSRHAHDTGLLSPRRGSRHHASKLDEASVIAIRAAAAQGVSQKEIAATHNVSGGTICEIISRKAWKHVTDPLTNKVTHGEC